MPQNNPTQTDAVNLPQSYGLHLIEQAKDIATNLLDTQRRSQLAIMDRTVAFLTMWAVYTYVIAFLLF